MIKFEANTNDDGDDDERKHGLLNIAECGVHEEKVVLPYDIENSLFCTRFSLLLKNNEKRINVL
jgi:hypothetical protein